MNVRTTFGFTPLHYAALKGHALAAKALVLGRADLQVRADGGQGEITPLGVAHKEGHSPEFCLLLQPAATDLL